MGRPSTAQASTVVLLSLLACGGCSPFRRAARPVDLGSDYRQAAQPAPSLRSACGEGQRQLWTDQQDFYSRTSMRDMALALAAGSVAANTSIDQDYRDWYQEDVQNRGTDRLADLWEPLGRGEIFIPAMACVALAGSLCDDTPLGSASGDFGWRTTRAYLVGAPPMLFAQLALGGSRPYDKAGESHWKPFEDDNGVSGHAFIGAVPLMTAAKMTDDAWLKGGFYFLSTLPAWSRVNDDQHYLSQACLGWWMAYLACNAVERTECEDSQLTFTPVTSAEMVGIGVIYER